MIAPRILSLCIITPLGAHGLKRLRAVVLGLILAIGGGHAFANPIVVDAERRPVAMCSERVEVTVGADQSRVNGVYRFQQTFPSTSQQKHVTIFVPVFLPNALTSRQCDTLYGVPHVVISGRAFSTSAWTDISLDGSPESVPLPRGWSMQIYVCNVPVRILGRDFEARISYVQPHLPHEIAAYVPIRPPRDKAACVVAFTAAPGRKLRRGSWLPLFSPGKDALQFTPTDRKLIRVQSLKAPSGR